MRIPEILSDIAEKLEDLIEEIVLAHDPLTVIVAGSLAEGKFVRGLSDLDILVVLRDPVPENERFTLRALKDVDVEITLVSLEELEKALAEGRDFYVSAVRSGVVIYGRDLKTELGLGNSG